MGESVKARKASRHYDANYGNFESELCGEIRREAFGEDIGQSSWLSAEEQDRSLGLLGLYDIKAAMHTLRLLYECIELMNEGRITLPRPEKDLLVHVRTGNWTLEKLIQEAYKLFAMAKEAQLHSKLPESIDRDRISSLITDAYLHHWKQSSLHPV